jgi:hypothetical protein
MRDIREMQYRIAFADDSELIDGQDFAFLEAEQEMWLAYRRGLSEQALVRALEESWAAFRQMAS